MPRKRVSIPRRSLGFARVRAVRMRKSGARVGDIAKLFDVSRETVSRWLTQYKAGGARSLKGKKSSGRPRKIDCSEFSPKLNKIIKHPATKFGFENPLWTCQRIKKVIHSELKLKLSRSTVWRALRETNLSCQKPERRAFEQDPVARKHWIEKEWPKLKNKAKKQRAVILFEDESSVALNPSIGRTWGKVGVTPIVYTTGNRGSVSVISAISPSGKLYFTLPKANVDSEVFINFIKQILREIPRKKIFMVVDNGSSHTSKKTRDFVASIDRLDLVYLPTYSPEFNPDEYTWEHLKTVKMKTHTARTKVDLKRKTLGAMRSIQKKKSLVKSFYKRAYVT
jgi:transposase